MSCVVKSCKNRSDRRKKHPGITFHRFPKDNEPWRNDWIDIIKKCNCEIDWSPNKYSVICSKHFEDNDLYVTKGGLRRIVTYAIPQKFLFDSDRMEVEQNAAVNVLCTVTSSASEETAPVTALEESYPSTMVLKQEKQHADPNISNDFPEIIPVTLVIEESCPSTMVFKQEKQPADPYISSDLQESAPVTLFFKESYPSTMFIKQENPAEPADPISSGLQEKPSEVGPAEDEEMSSIRESLRTRRLKYSLMKKQEFIKKQKREIKTLKQKIKRLQSRNKSLKEILRTVPRL